MPEKAPPPAFERDSDRHRTHDERNASDSSADSFPAPSTAPLASLTRAAAIWLFIALLLLVAMYVRLRHMSFDGDFQGWASASCMTMAESFNHLGPLHTHFVPIQNNLPLGSHPDVYLHWPPLFPLLLSFVLRLFGDHESSGRFFAMAITCASAGIVFLIGRHLYNTRVALLSCFFFFTSRATYEGARAVLHQPLAMFFGSATVLCFLLATRESSPPSRSMPWTLLGLVSTVCTVLTAWDPVFIPVGLFLAALYLRQRKALRIAAVYVLADVLTFVAVQADYLLTYPSLFKNQFATIAYRAGVKFDGGSSLRLHGIVDRVHYVGGLSLVGSYSHAVRFVYQYFNVLTLLAVPVFLALCVQAGKRRHAPTLYLVGGLLFPGLLWYALMRNYVAVHPFVLVLFAPIVALASGFVLNWLWTALNTRNQQPLLWVMLLILPALVLYPLGMYVVDAHVPFEAAQFQSLSPLIAHNTPPNAVVLSPAESAVPIYYSNRHIVRGIENDDWLRVAIPQAYADFPGSPLYLAIQDPDQSQFPQSLPSLKLVARLGDSTLYSLNESKLRSAAQ
jgi:4-amino-4-deoxy-L-arabinose transferase-like glycosyltransferase